MKIRIIVLILFSFILSGCFATAGAVFGGLNIAYNGLQEYRQFKKNVKEIKKRRTELPRPPGCISRIAVVTAGPIA